MSRICSGGTAELSPVSLPEMLAAGRDACLGLLIGRNVIAN
jgi:hypothetical protein